MSNITLNYIVIPTPLLIILVVLITAFTLYFVILYYKNIQKHRNNSYLLFQKHKEINDKEEEIKVQADNLIKQKKEINKQQRAVSEYNH